MYKNNIIQELHSIIRLATPPNCIAYIPINAIVNNQTAPTSTPWTFSFPVNRMMAIMAIQQAANFHVGASGKPNTGQIDITQGQNTISIVK